MCVHCGLPTQRNFGSFDTLPLVEFVPTHNIPETKVLSALRMYPPDEGMEMQSAQPKKKTTTKGPDGWNQNEEGEEQTLTFNQNDTLENDLFSQRMLEFAATQTNPEAYRPVEVDEHILKSMRWEEVFIVDMDHFGGGLQKKYYKNMSPDVAINKCENCQKFFIQDEYEFAYMDLGHCPFCKNVEKDKGVKAIYGSLADMQQ